MNGIFGAIAIVFATLLVFALPTLDETTKAQMAILFLAIAGAGLIARADR